MIKVNLYTNPHDKTREVAEVDDLLKFLAWNFEKFPEHGLIFHNCISAATNVTPRHYDDIEKLKRLRGEFYVIVYPADMGLSAIIAIVAAVVSVGVSIYTYATMPRQKNQAQQSPNNELVNRQNTPRLGGRVPDVLGENGAAYPDIISETYTYYRESDGVEVERQLLALCRQHVEVYEVKESTTNVRDIPEMSVSIYDPGTNITGMPIYQAGRTFTDLPKEVRKSKAITGQTLDSPNDFVIESNQLTFHADGSIQTTSGGINFSADFSADESIVVTGATFGTKDFTYSGAILLTDDRHVIFESSEAITAFNKYTGLQLNAALVTQEVTRTRTVYDTVYDEYNEPVQVPRTETYTITDVIDYSGQYEVNGITRSTTETGYRYDVVIANAAEVNPNWSNIDTDFTVNATAILNRNTDSIYLDDIYVIKSVAAKKIELISPEAVNENWLKLINLSSQSTKVQESTVTLDKVSSKWVGWHNLYLKDAEELVLNIHFPQGLYRQNSKGGTSDDWTSVALEWQLIDINGQPYSDIQRFNKRYYGKTRISFGKTERVAMNTMGGIRFRVCRTRADIANNVQATMNLKDVYLTKSLDKYYYPEFTVIQSEAIGTDGLYSIKERKLNVHCMSKIRVDGVGNRVATKSIDQIFIHAALDPFIGRREIYELDVPQIKSVMQEVKSYFGSNEAAQFCGTLDDLNLSWEETAQMITSAGFCEAYRLGIVHRLYFDKPQPQATLLFNSRNKLMGSETWTYTNIIDNEYNGIEFEYTSPDDDTRITYKIPEDGSANNPMKINSTGIRSHAQAKTRAWREWNKMRFKRISCQFDGFEETNLINKSNKILNVNSVGLTTQDGEIVAVDGYVLTLSEDVYFESETQNICLQIYDQESGNTLVDIVPCKATDEHDQVRLLRMPIHPLIVENGQLMPTVYNLINPHEADKTPFIVTSVKPRDANTNTVNAINYTDAYYQDDHRFFS